MKKSEEILASSKTEIEKAGLIRDKSLSRNNYGMAQANSLTRLNDSD